MLQLRINAPASHWIVEKLPNLKKPHSGFPEIQRSGFIRASYHPHFFVWDPVWKDLRPFLSQFWVHRIMVHRVVITCFPYGKWLTYMNCHCHVHCHVQSEVWWLKLRLAVRLLGFCRLSISAPPDSLVHKVFSLEFHNVHLEHRMHTSRLSMLVDNMLEVTVQVISYGI